MMDIHEIVKKLIGPIDPVGETRADAVRLENLKMAIHLVEEMVSELHGVATHAIRQEFSMAKAGKLADQFLKDLSSDLNGVPQ